MPAFPRDELEEMVRRWLDANRQAEQARDWRPLAALYTPEATYGWNLGPGEEFMAVGRDEIRDVALGLEMGGFDGWTYPYERILIDDSLGEVVGFWRQIAPTLRPDGSRHEVAGVGGSWFRYGGEFQWSWQRDFFDVGNFTAVFIEMLKANLLSDGMKERMERAGSGGAQPGHHRLGAAPVGLWE
jgi:hypothetical protein